MMEILDYFTSYYGASKYKNFKNKLVETNYELSKCKDCKFIWQKNINKNFSIELYENIIDKEKSLLKSKLKFLNQKNSNNKEIKKIIRNFYKEKKKLIYSILCRMGHWLIQIKLIFFSLRF